MPVFHFNLKNNDSTKTYINADLNFFASNSIQIISNGFTGFFIDVLTEKSDDVIYDGTTGTLTLPIKIKGLSKTINATEPDNDYTVGKSFFPPSGSSDIYYTVEDTSTPIYSFKHLYSGKNIGTGPIKFKSYTQTKPVTGETWLLNETLSDLTIDYTTADKSYPYISNGTRFMYINRTYSTAFGGVDLLTYWRDSNSTNTIDVYDSGSWTNEAYRTITFEEAVTDSELLAWLEANGVKQA